MNDGHGPNPALELFDELVELPPGERTRFLVARCADDDDTRRSVRDKAVEKQIDEQEVSEVIHCESHLDAVVVDAQTFAGLHPGVANDGAQRQVALVDLSDEASHRGRRCEIEIESGDGVAAALAGDALHRGVRRLPIAAGDDDVPTALCKRASAFETDARVASSDQHRVASHALAHRPGPPFGQARLAR